MHKMCTKNLPKRLHKYVSLRCPRHIERLHDTFLQNKLFFGSAKQFNDPFDCRCRLSLGSTDSEKRKALSQLLRTTSPDLAGFAREEEIERLIEGLTPEAKEEFVRAVQKGAYALGVLCLAERPDDLIMWAHYGDSHAGACLEFDTSHAPFSEAINVRYEELYLEVSCAENDMNRMGVEMLFTKAASWHYEKEWRIVEDEQGPHPFEPEALVGIICGHRVSHSVLGQVREWASDRGVGIKVARPNAERYELVIDATN